MLLGLSCTIEGGRLALLQAGIASVVRLKFFASDTSVLPFEKIELALQRKIISLLSNMAAGLGSKAIFGHQAEMRSGMKDLLKSSNKEDQDTARIFIEKYADRMCPILAGS